jgi:peptidoglycan/LPS O-acetylase OafA/YrhL
MPSDRILSIQYLRALAAVLVVFNHGWDQLVWFKERFPNPIGLSGVDIFFVISGFVMVFITNRREQSPSDFIVARVVRVVPIYWFYTFGTALLLVAAPELFQKNELTAAHFLLSLAFIPHQSPVDPESLGPMVKLGWTLNYEMFFYVLFTVAIAISLVRRTWIAIGALLLLAVYGLVTQPPGNTVVGFYTSGLILEFAFGMILATLFGRRSELRFHWIFPVAVLLGCAGIFIGSYYYGWDRRLVVYGIPAAFIVGGSLALEWAGRVRMARLPLLIGNASYSIYLAHLFPIALLRYVWGRANLPEEGWFPTAIFVGLAVVFGVAAGIVSYLVIEAPMLRVCRSAIGRMRNPPVVPAPGRSGANQS